MTTELAKQVERLRELLEKIQSQPWRWQPDDEEDGCLLSPNGPVVYGVWHNDTSAGCEASSEEDAEFIALARNAMPALLAELARLREVVRQYEISPEDARRREFPDEYCLRCNDELDTDGYCDTCATEAEEAESAAVIALDEGERAPDLGEGKLKE